MSSPADSFTQNISEGISGLYQIWKSDKDGKWYWHFRAPGNHEIVAGGEGYERASGCERAVQLLQGSGSARVEVMDGTR